MRSPAPHASGSKKPRAPAVPPQTKAESFPSADAPVPAPPRAGTIQRTAPGIPPSGPSSIPPREGEVLLRRRRVGRKCGSRKPAQARSVQREGERKAGLLGCEFESDDRIQPIVAAAEMEPFLRRLLNTFKLNVSSFS